MTDQPSGFGNYPTMPPAPAEQPVTAGPPPTSVENAVKLMFARAAVGLLSLLALVASRDSLKDQILKSNPSYDPAKIDSTASVAITAGIIIGLIFLAMYVLLALQVRKGKQWARIVTWVVAGLAVASGLLTLSQPEPALTRLLGLITIVLDIGIIVLLALRPSAEYFRRTR